MQEKAIQNLSKMALEDVPRWVEQIKEKVRSSPHFLCPEIHDLNEYPDHTKGYCIVPNFLSRDEVATIKHAFQHEVPTVRMPGLGDDTG